MTRIIRIRVNLFMFPPTFDLSLTTVQLRTAPAGATVETSAAAYNHLLWQGSAPSYTKKENQMKTSLLIGALSLVVLIAGCNNSPAAPVPGPAGPQGQVGQTGATGDTGQTGDRGRTGYTGDAGQVGQTGDTGQTGQTGDRGRTGDSGQAGRTGDSGQTGRTGDQGIQGQAAPCPAGEHRYTDRDSGRASCVRD
jgi:hypothetical protein